jgi:hypothetical protein
MRPKTKTDCPGEAQQQFNRPNRSFSNSQTPPLVGGHISIHVKAWKEQKYGHGSRYQDLLCWRGPAVIYPTDRQTKQVFQAVREQNIVMSPVGLGTKNDWAGEGHQQLTQPYPIWESSGSKMWSWLCWGGTSSNLPDRPTEVSTHIFLVFLRDVSEVPTLLLPASHAAFKIFNSSKLNPIVIKTTKINFPNYTVRNEYRVHLSRNSQNFMEPKGFITLLNLMFSEQWLWKVPHSSV